MPLKRRSLRRQLLIYLFASAVIVFLLTELIFIEKNRRSLVKMLDKNAQAYALNLVAMMRSEPGRTIGLDSFDDMIREFGDHRMSVYFLILRVSDNAEIGRSESMRNVSLSLPTSLRGLPRGVAHSWNARIDGQRVRFVALRESAQTYTETQEGRSLNGDECFFIVGLSQRYMWKRLQETIEVTAPVLGIGLAVMLLLSWMVVHQGLKPIRKLEREVKSISSSNLTPVTVPEIREFANAATTLNAIIGKLKESFERERRFTANVAHELRTRISEMRALAEVALRYEDNLNEQDRRNYEEILVSAKEMQATVMNLLTLARCHSGQLKPQKETVELQALVECVWRKWEKDASARGLAVRCDVPANLLIVTDKDLFETILQNLFSNAVSYAAERGTVEWKADARGGEFCFSLSNSVENLSETDLPYMFEPFWRKDKARSSDENHSGLGLSLVQSLTGVLGFAVNARLTTPTVLTVTLSGKTCHVV
jgi:two-component system sensor histidine kinase QseC